MKIDVIAIPASRRKIVQNQRRPGRPEGGGSAKGRIIDAAEVVFSQQGYAGASLRDIVVRAQVTPALINYYFDSKEQLFTEVYLNRSRQIVKQRMESLERLYESGKAFTIEELLSAFLDPALAMRQARAGRAFIRLQSRVHIEPLRFVKRLRRQVFNECIRAFVAAIQKVVPHISDKTAFWRMILVIGAYAYVYSDAHRLEEISQGICNPDDFDEMLAQTKAFVIGGMMAPSAKRLQRRQSDVQRRSASPIAKRNNVKGS